MVTSGRRSAIIPPNPGEFRGLNVVDCLLDKERSSCACLLATAKVSVECYYHPISKPGKCSEFEKYHPALYSSVKSIHVLAQSCISYDLFKLFWSTEIVM